MKLLLTLLLSIAFIGVRAQRVDSLPFDNTSGTLRTMPDTMPYMYPFPLCNTFQYLDSKQIRDSVCRVNGAHVYYLFNYKQVPLGLYCDTCKRHDKKQGVWWYEYRVFYNRVSLFSDYFENRYRDYYGGATADINQLKKLLIK